MRLYRLVCGLRSEATQRKLLIEADLTFKKALKITQSNETASAIVKQLQSPRIGRDAERYVYKITDHGPRSQHREPVAHGNGCFAVGTQTKNMPSASSKTAPVITVVRWDICNEFVQRQEKPHIQLKSSLFTIYYSEHVGFVRNVHILSQIFHVQQIFENHGYARYLCMHAHNQSMVSEYHMHKERR